MQFDHVIHRPQRHAWRSEPLHAHPPRCDSRVAAVEQRRCLTPGDETGERASLELGGHPPARNPWKTNGLWLQLHSRLRRWSQMDLELLLRLCQVFPCPSALSNPLVFNPPFNRGWPHSSGPTPPRTDFVPPWYAPEWPQSSRGAASPRGMKLASDLPSNWAAIHRLETPGKSMGCGFSCIADCADDRRWDGC